MIKVSPVRHAVILATLAVATACADPAAPAARPADADAAVSSNTITVTTTAELLAALVPDNAGRRILLRAGTYDIAQPIVVPDGITLVGEGAMHADASGLPVGFGSGAHATIRMTATVAGDVLTLGNDVTVRRLEIADRPGRSGNVVAVYSRAPGDHVEASVVEAEIVGANAGFYGLYAQTRNLNLGNDPPPHDGASVAVRMAHSIERTSAGGRGVFAFNFASKATVDVKLVGNVLDGMTANGGVSLPDPVRESEVRIESLGNRYRNEAADPCAAPVVGWNLTGGSGAPAPVPAAGTAHNTLRMRSVGDRVEGFTTAIQAAGARRYFAPPIAGPADANTLELELLGATLATPSCGGRQVVRDLELKGAFSASDALVPGNGNTLRAVIRQVTGSGPRSNLYADAAGASAPLPPAAQGTGNRLIVVGSPEAFARTNRHIEPPPGPEFFTSRSH